MRQEVYADDRSLSDYDEDRSWRVFVHLCSAAQWTAITGEMPFFPVDPAKVVTVKGTPGDAVADGDW